jgi:hypothetical protein
MSTLREEFERHMSECGLSVGARDDEGYIASHVEARWQSYQAATERAAKLAANLAYDAAIKYANGREVDFEQEVAAAIRGDRGAV